MIQSMHDFQDEADDTLRAAVHEALQKLHARQRTAITLRVFDGLSSKAISVRLNISPSAVDLLIFRAKNSLRVLLAEFVEDK